MTLPPDPPATDAPSGAAPPAAHPPVPLVFETATVLLLAVVPDIVAAGFSFAFRDASAGAYPFSYTMSRGLVRSFQVCAPLLYILSRNREPWSDFGLARPRLRIDVPVLLVAIAGSYAAWYAAIWGLYYAFPDFYRSLYNTHAPASSFYAGPATPADYALLTIGSLANGFAEEFVMRAYLIRRFEQLFGSTSGAVVGTAALFAAYHLYYGPFGTLYVLCIGLAFGATYARFRRLWPLAIAHALWDFYGFYRLH